MRIFYQEENNHLIIAPFRCGSTYLKDNCDYLKIIYLQSLGTAGMGKKIFEKLLNQENVTKTFLYRDPVERFISYFNKFIQPYAGQTSFAKKKVLQKFTNSSLIQKYFLEATSDENIWINMYECLPILQKYYKEDWHTNLQKSYFDYTQEKITDYNIISMLSYDKWIYLSFGEKIEYKSNLKDSLGGVNGFDVLRCMEIYTGLKTLYKEDYDIFSTEIVQTL